MLVFIQLLDGACDSPKRIALNGESAVAGLRCPMVLRLKRPTSEFPKRKVDVIV
ncbi:hypothetical protein [Cryobacterium sp. TMT2-15-1]|uniref:hypothetical protein n=1 Tax=Cryobacterium sp. TMT2-15-1 TaxID=1259246 RepID=UPI00141B1FE6|nr:hypothetical protein [Cryobacterium sp. TMT2-15-1]